MFEQFGHILYECGAYHVEESRRANCMLQFTQKPSIERSGAGYLTRCTCSTEEMSLTVSVDSLLTWGYSAVTS